MNKEKFLKLLRKAISALPRKEINERITFYSEMIDDRMEEGFSEEEALARVGSVEEIARQILAEADVEVKGKSGRRLRAWEIVLLALGSPLWIALLAAAFALVISLLAVLWAVIVSFWAVFAALAGSALGGVLGGAGFVALGNTPSGLALIAAGMACAGLGILSLFGCKAATVGGVVLTKKMALGIKNCFRKKEEV